MLCVQTKNTLKIWALFFSLCLTLSHATISYALEEIVDTDTDSTVENTQSPKNKQVFQRKISFESFTVEDIRLEGVKRVSSGTVFNYLPVKVGDVFDESHSQKVISTLFKTDFFEDIRLEREGKVLVVRLEERPAISQITFRGNDDIDEDELKESLKSIGLARGRLFNRSLLDKAKQMLKHQYVTLSKYRARVDVLVVPLDRNRVAIDIDISEGKASKIQQVNFVGNYDFKDKELRDEMRLGVKKWGFLSFFTDNKYADQKLSGDLESLRTFYLEQGYLKFNIDSKQVSITPDKESIYITINITEGDQYTFSEAKLLGNLIVPEAELRKNITFKTGDMFSQKAVIQAVEGMIERLGTEGYAFATVNPVFKENEDNKTVELTFFVDPGRRIYVRRINFAGNTKTKDEVLRREMRQMEGGLFSTKNVKRSTERLERLNFFESVEMEQNLVPEAIDQVDLDYTVIEKPSGSLMAGVGYSQAQGVLFNASIMQENLLGSGKQVGLSFNNSPVYTAYNLSYLNPYINVDGVSRGVSLIYRRIDAARASLSRYITDTAGAQINYGIPISEFNKIALGFELDNTLLKTTDASAEEVFHFIDEFGDNYNSYRMTAGWSEDTRNRTLFPDKGMLKSLRAEVTVPVSDLNYYKLSYRHHWLHPLTKKYTLLLKGELAYGEGYGENSDLPFFENYFAGGLRTVRGFEDGSLGPLDSNDRPLGGNFRVVGNAEIILPLPFAEKAHQFRSTLFIDGGNVYGPSEDFDSDTLRYSAGISFIWMSPMGPFSFSLAKPLKDMDGDRTEFFQFSLGTTFW